VYYSMTAIEEIVRVNHGSEGYGVNNVCICVYVSRAVGTKKRGSEVVC